MAPTHRAIQNVLPSLRRCFVTTVKQDGRIALGANSAVLSAARPVRFDEPTHNQNHVRRLTGSSTLRSGSAAVASSSSASPAGILGGILDEHAAKHAFRDALRGLHIKWTYQDFKKHVDAFAVGLIQNNYKPGDKILTLLSSGAESIVAYLAAAKTGVVLVAPASADQISELLPLVKPRGILVDPLFDGTDVIALLNKLLPEAALSDGGLPLASLKYPYLRNAIHTGSDRVIGFDRYRTILVYGPSTSPLPKVTKALSADLPVIAQVVEGDKVVVLSHKDIIEKAESLSKSLKVTPDDRIAVYASFLYPLLAGALGATTSLVNGAAAYAPAALQLRDSLGKYLTAERATVLYGDSASLAEKPDTVRGLNVVQEIKSLPTVPLKADTL